MTWEEICDGKTLLDEARRDMVRKVNYLKVGPYIDELKDANLKFYGSSNQRIIDVQHTTDPAKPAILNL